MLNSNLTFSDFSQIQFKAGKELYVEQERETVIEDIAPPYLSQHNVIPARWNYLPDEKPYYSMAFLMPPPYHTTKQLLLTSSKLQNNNNDEHMMNKNYSTPNSVEQKEEQTAYDDFGFDLQSVVSMEILENQDQYKQTLKYYPKQQLTTFVEAKNQEVLKRVAEMQKMVENSQRYLNENGELICAVNDQNNKLNGSHNIWRETSVDIESDNESVSSSKQSSNEDAPNQPPPPGILKHSDSLTLLAETINQYLNGINKGLNSIFASRDGDNESQNNSTTASSSATNTPKSQRRVHGLSQIINDLHALGNDLSQSESDTESLYTPNSSPIRKNQVNETNGNNGMSNGFGNYLAPNKSQLYKNKDMKQIRTSFGLHSPDALGDTKDTNLKEYLRQLKEASSNDNGEGQDLAAQKIAELYGFELGDDSMIETDPDLIDLTTIPPPQTPDELDIPPVINKPPTEFDDVDGINHKSTTGDYLEEFLKKVTIEPPTSIVTPAVELTPEEILSYIIPPPPVSDVNVSNTTSKSFDVVKSKPSLTITQRNYESLNNHNYNNNGNHVNENVSAGMNGTLNVLKYTPKFPMPNTTQSPIGAKPIPVPRPRHFDNCNSFYDNYSNTNNCCNDLYNNSSPQINAYNNQSIIYNTGSPKVSGSSVKSKVEMFNNHSNSNSNCSTPTHQPKSHVIEYPTVERKGTFSCCSKENKTAINSNLCNGNEVSSSNNICNIANNVSNESDNNKQSIKLPPKRCPHFANNHSNIPVPERPPKSADLKLKLNSPIRMHPQQNNFNFNNYSLYNNTDNNFTTPSISSSGPPSLPPRINSPEVMKKPPLPPVPIKPFHYVAPNLQSPPITSPPPFSTAMRSPNPLMKNPNYYTHNSNSSDSNQSSPCRTIMSGSPLTLHRNPFMNRGEEHLHMNGIPTSLPMQQIGGTLQRISSANGHQRSTSDCPSVCLKNPSNSQRQQLTLLCSPQLPRKPLNNHYQLANQQSSSVPGSPLLSNKNGHVINVDTLLAKTNVAMSGLLIKLDQVAIQCTNAQQAGGGTDIDEDKFESTKNELTEQSLHLVTSSKLLVIAMSDVSAKNLPEHLTSCLTALRRITELAQNLVRYTSAPLQTRNVILKIHDVASSFRELACVQIGPAGSAQLALSANCLANVLSTLLRSLRVFSP